MTGSSGLGLLPGSASTLTMRSLLKEQLTVKNLFEKVFIPLAAFLVLGWVQAHVYDWERISNSSYKHAVEILAYALILFLMYLLLSPFLWLRPALKVKVYSTGSSTIRPQTSVVLHQQDPTKSQADLTMDIEFSPTWLTRRLYRLTGKDVGIRFSCPPANLLTCGSNILGDSGYYTFEGERLVLRPFGKMNLEESDPFAQYQFRFGLGTLQLVTRINLRPRHLNFRSRFLFGLRFDNPFLLDIQQKV